VLNFNLQSFIKADLVVNQNSEHLLYFTDNRNEPRKINATKALANEYSDLINSGSLPERNDFLAVCKKPPMFAPVIKFQTNEDRRVNRLRNVLFQFAYQYVYDDGEYSALSPASKLAVSSSHVSSTGDGPTVQVNNNEIRVTLKNSKGPVEKIILYVRQGNSGFYSRVTELKNLVGTVNQEFIFANDGIYIAAPDSDTQKTFDSVPRRAGAQTFSNNRLFYGNYVEGFDNIETDSNIHATLHPPGSNLTKIDVLLPEGGQINGPQVLPSRLNPVRMALGPDNEDFENVQWLGDVESTTISAEVIEDLQTAGLLSVGTAGATAGLAILAYQYAIWRGALDALVPDTKKTLGGGHFTASNAVIHDTKGYQITDNGAGAAIGNPTETTGDYSMAFDIDLSDTPSQGFEASASMTARIDCTGSSIGTANFGDVAGDYPVNIVVKGGNGVQLAHTPTEIRTLRNKSTTHRFDGDDYDNYKNVQLNGNFSGLEIESGMSFIQDVDLSNKSRQEAGEAVADAMVGLTSSMFVRSEKRENYGPKERWRGSEALKGEGPDGEYLFSSCPLNAYSSNVTVGANDSGNNTNEDKDQSLIYISWSGFYDFIIKSASYDSVANKVRCVIAPTALTLEADEGLVGKFNTGTNERKKNYFLKDAGKATDAKSHTSTYNDASIECRVALDAAKLNGEGIVTAINNFNVQGTLEVVTDTGVEEMASFKSGANHDFGVVYFDDRGRHGGVQRLDSVEIPHLHDKQRNFGVGPSLSGRSEVDIRINHEPPKWASTYAPVYGGSTTYDYYLYTGISEAFIPTKAFKRDIRSTNADAEDTVNNSAVILSGMGGEVSSSIFLSTRPLEGKPNSAKELMGSIKTYQYQEGDRLRIVSYVDTAGKTQFPDIELPITGYQYLVDDENNPLEVIAESTGTEAERKKNDVYRSTGWFLSIKEPRIPGFTRRDVQQAKDFFSQNCLIQIVRYKKGTENPVYNEIGEMYPIVEADDGRRSHGATRPPFRQVSLTVAVSSTNVHTFNSDTRLYVGDRIQNSNAVTGYFDIVKVIPRESGGFTYKVSIDTPFKVSAKGTSFSTNLTPTQGCLTLKSGDAYLKLRRMLVNAQTNYEPPGSAGSLYTFNPTTPKEAVYRSHVVEDDSVSDFFESNSRSVGRAHIENVEQSEIRRVSSITYSDPFAFDSNRLNLSSFNPSLFPYKDMPSKHGEVTFLVDGNESLTVLQESKVSLVPVNRNVVQMGSDSSMVTSTDVLGSPTFMAGSFGPGVTPDGVVERFGQVYFSDVRSGRVCRIDGQGIMPISEVKMESYFEGLFGGVNNCVAVPKIPSGFDPENSEYIVTTEPIDFVKLVLASSTIGFASKPDADSVFTDIKTQPTFSKSMLISWSTEKMEWDEVDDLDPNNHSDFNPYLPNWDEMHQGVMYIDRITERSGVYIDPEFESAFKSSARRVSGAATSPIVSEIKIDMIDQLKTVRGFCRISLKDHTVDAKTVASSSDLLVTMISMTSSGPDTSVLTISPVVDPEKATVAWSPNAEKWLTFYSFIPELYANIQNRFFSFKDGKMWQHNQTAVRNSFYEETVDLTKRYPSKLTLISKGNPSSVKMYKAMSTEGNRPWKATFSNDSQRVASIEATHFHEKEGMRYANIPRVFDNNLANAETPANGNNDDIPSSAYRLVGAVESVDGDTITFTTNVNLSPVITGPSAKVVRYRSTDNGWTDVTGSWKVTSLISPNKAQLSATATDVQAGDLIANVYTTGVDGDVFRGYYAQVALENSESKDGGWSGPIEFYAANMVYEASSLHNDNNQ